MVSKPNRREAVQVCDAFVSMFAYVGMPKMLVLAYYVLGAIGIGVVIGTFLADRWSQKHKLTG